MPQLTITNWQTRAEMFEKKVHELEQERDKLKAQLISGFYEDEYPIYTQGEPVMNLQSLANAQEINNLVQMLKNKVTEIDKLREKIDQLHRNQA